MTKLDAALEYARRGFRIFPLFYVLKDGSCSCRPSQGRPCKRIGKHPTTRNGLMDATTDEATIRQWWTESPHANIGVATGHDGRIVIDVDCGLKPDGTNKVGKETLTHLEEQYEVLPPTLMVRTGSGGLHYWFLSDAEIKNDQGKKLGKDIDIRGHGGYVILPPSNHTSGGKYEWVDGITEIAQMPKWMEERCAGKRAKATINPAEDTLQEDIIKEVKETKKLSSEQLAKLLDFIPPDCDRDAWWQIGAALKKELGEKGFAIWDAWSKKSGDKYDPKVMPVQWESFTDKGITGGTIAHYAKTLGDFRGFDIEAADTPEFRNDWVYVASIKRFVKLDKLVEWDREQFDAMHAASFTKGKPSDNVLKNPAFRRVNSATYWPEQGLWVNEFGIDKLNYWRSGGVTPVEGDVGPFEDHIDYLFPEGPEAKILRQYLAYQVQNPGKKVHWAVLVEGMPGNGKSYFASVMRAVLGEGNVRILSNEALHETYTGWQRNTQFIIVEEMMARQRLELMNKLKPMITEPWCSIREMYRPPYEQPNRFNFLFFSNHCDSLLIDDKDRRYCILKTDAAPQAPTYYKRLFDWTSQNAPALLAHLMAVDLSDFRPQAHAPMTEGKRALINQSMMPLDAFIHEHVESREYPFRWDIHSAALLVEPLSKMNLRCNPKEIGNAFQRLGYVNLGRARTNGDERVYLWAVRNGETYAEMSAAQLRQVWIGQENDTINRVDEAVVEALSKQAPKNKLKNGEAM